MVDPNDRELNRANQNGASASITRAPRPATSMRGAGHRLTPAGRIAGRRRGDGRQGARADMDGDLPDEI